MPFPDWFRRKVRRWSASARRPSGLRIEPLEHRLLLHHDPGHTLQSHTHSYLSVYFDGVRQVIPADVGVGPGLIAPVHTHDTTGKLHVEPAEATYQLSPPSRFPNLGDFFEVWRTHGGNAGNNANASFSSSRILDRVADATHLVRFYVNGAINTEYQNYVLRDGDDLVIAYDTITSLNQPTLSPIDPVTVLSGAPLHVPLNGYDANGGPLSYTVNVSPVSGNPQLVASVLEGNRSARIRIRNHGDMVFELFDDKAPRATNHFVALANLDVPDGQGGTKKFHEGIIFHRVIDGFMIQGGDPTGTGTGGSPLNNFDDQFHVDLQHNRRGLLSMAKAVDGGNDSQFFITETATRNLDFNHTVFGLLVEGDGVREAISGVPVVVCPVGQDNCPNKDKPLSNVVIDSVTVFDDQENGVLMLKANGTAGAADVAVTVRDAQNNTFTRTFRVTVNPDASNGLPFLADFNTNLRTTAGVAANIPISGLDVENSPVRFMAWAPAGISVNLPSQNVTPVNQTASATLTVTPAAGALGRYEVHLMGLDPAYTFSNGTLLSFVTEDFQKHNGQWTRGGLFDSYLDRQIVTVSVTRAVTCDLADLNDNRRVDRGDLVVLTSSLGATVAQPGSGADIDGDGSVSVRDLAALRSFFGQNCPASSAAAPDAVLAHASDPSTVVESSPRLAAGRIDAVLTGWKESRAQAIVARFSPESAPVEGSPRRARLTAKRSVAAGQHSVEPSPQQLLGDSQPLGG